jgi:hypothetical protein
MRLYPQATAWERPKIVMKWQFLEKGDGDVGTSTCNDGKVMSSNTTPSRTRVKGGSEKTEDAD